MRARFVLVFVVLSLHALGCPGGGEGEGEGEDDCADAKQHVCDNIEGQACSTETMDNAMDKVRAECGDDVADNFAPAVEDACEANALDTCQEL